MSYEKRILGRARRESEREYGADKMRWQAKWCCSSLPSPEACVTCDLYFDIQNGQPRNSTILLEEHAEDQSRRPLVLRCTSVRCDLQATYITYHQQLIFMSMRAIISGN